ncbi:MAG: flavodoxin family protein [Candidatus Methanoplasma sp.]|jgi:multimeric flavodoxin WrbA|nr:flavodoxin family protein [Candidatus Methanoplasma sp.]
MKVLLINGSPRADGNTSELVKRFIGDIGNKASVEEVRIFNTDIKGCKNCGACQRAVLEKHCTVNDGMSALYPKFLSSDVVIIASPIYMWQFTPCTLAFLNRLHCLCHSADFSYNEMAGKKMAALVTLGDEEEVADFAVNGLKEFCTFFSIGYLGDLRIPFASKEKISSGEYDKRIKGFAEMILG